MRKIKFVKRKYYHIFNRGVDKRNIFNDDRDKWRFLQGMFLFNDEKSSFGILHEIARKNKGRINFHLLEEFISNEQKDRKPLVQIGADCLMPNHYHLLLREIEDGGISRFMHKFGIGYTKYFNKKYDRVGSLFQGPFKAVAVEKDIYLLYLLVYINVINPGQLVLVEPELKEKGVNNVEKVMAFAKKYSFGTHRDYLGIRNSVIIDKEIIGNFFPDPKEYEEFVRNTLLSRRYQVVSDLFLE